MIPGKWTREVHEKARVIHSQIAALQTKARESNDADRLTALLSEPYFKLLDRLFTDELPWAQAMDNSDLVVRLQGPAASEDAPRIKLISDTFDAVRDQVHKIAKAIAGISPGRGKLPADVDLGLSGFARGSVVIGVKVRAVEDLKQVSLLGEDDPLLVATREALHQLGEVPRYISETGLDDRFAQAIPDPSVRDTVLAAAVKLGPTGYRGIDSVELSSPGSPGKRAPITPHIRTLMRHAMVRPVKQTETGQFVGVVRELDLDLMRFDLRRIADEMSSIRCAYFDLSEPRALSLLNSLVRVTGAVEFGANKTPRLLQVERLEVLGSLADQAKMDFGGNEIVPK
jgi:hypothetical protein